MQLNPLQYKSTFLEPLIVTQDSAWVEHIPFAYALVEMIKPGTLVELGVHGGDSYCAFCQAVESLGLPTQCFGVDTWQGDKHAGKYSQDVLINLRKHHDPKYGTFSKLMQMEFDAAATHFQDGSLDLLHIDGLHTYDAVKHDFETWLPKMSSRGVILFHDTFTRDRDFGVYQLWAELSTKYPHFHFEHGSGLGVLAVGSDIPEGLKPFINADQDDTTRIRLFYSRLGRGIHVQRYHTGVLMFSFQGQSLINQWRQITGQAIRPETQNFQTALNNPAAFTHNLLQEIHALATADVNLRQQIQAERQMHAPYPMALPTQR